MFDRLEDIVKHYEELMFELNNPSVAEDQKRFRKLMKEQSDLTPLVETYKEYKQVRPLRPSRTPREGSRCSWPS